ncbi:hypothetical protein [Nocardioides speluncae]|uniref:hypothetical protein n=1 Tax=Nocardioides speluncae TaxID=2670337 RepID=UPI0012B16886|nr:hypothetical protein [Nocardioides speluncae]
MASQQTITAVGGMQQNPCGAQEASLFFVNTTDWGTCAVSDGGATVPAGAGAGSGGHSDVASQQTITAVGGMQQNPCGAQAASLFFVNTTDWGTCAVSNGGATGAVPAGAGWGSGGHSDVASQQTITAVGGMQQNPCGAQEASLFFVNTTDWGTCATGNGGAVAAVPAGAGAGSGGHSDVASQQTITAVGGMQQNPCGAQEASLFFVNSTDWGTCAVSNGSAPAGTGGGWGSGGHSDVASQQTITAVGGMQQNPCGAQEASLFFVNTTDWGTCAVSNGSAPAGTGGGWGSGGQTDVASQQTITAVGGMQQNPCGAQEASLFFVNTTDWGTCAVSNGSAPAGTGGGWGSGGHSDVASQQTITAVGGMQQNPCGAQEASLFFVNTTDWGTCATGNGGVGTLPAGAGGTGGQTDVASQQTITAVGGMQQNPCGAQEASLFFVNSTDWGTCAVSNGSAPAGTGGGWGSGGHSDVASQQTITAIGGMQQNPCGAQEASLFFVNTTDWGTCAVGNGPGTSPAPGGTGGWGSGGHSDVASQQTITAVGGMQQNPCGAQEASLFFVNTTDWGTCAVSNGSAPAGTGGGWGSGGQTDVASQQTITAVGGMQQNPCGAQEASLFFVNTTDWGTCAVSNGSAPAGTGGGWGSGGHSDVASQQTITAIGGMQQNPCGAQEASLFFVNTTDWGTCAVGNGPGTSPAPGGTGGWGSGGHTDVASQQTITAIGGMQQNPCGAQVASLFFVNSTDWGTCAVSDGGGQPGPVPPPTPPPGGDSQLTVGTPTVNGQAAGAAPGPNTPAGAPAAIVVPIQNSGDAPVTGISGATPDGAMTCGSTELAPGESTTCAMATTADSGAQTVPVQVTGTGPGGTQVSGNGTVYYTGTPAVPPPGGTGGLTVSTPTVNGQPAGTAPGPAVPEGEQASIEVAVQNTGDGSVSDLSGATPSGELTCDSTELAPGESTTCSIDAGSTPGPNVVPIAVTAEGEDGAPVAGSTVAYYTGSAPDSGDGPEITVGNPSVNGEDALSAPGPQVAPEDDAQIEVPVTNTGGTDISGLQGSSVAGDLTCESTDLAPGESTTCSVAADVAAGDNSVPIEVTGESPDGAPVSDDTTAHYVGTGSAGQPEVTIGEPTVNGMPAGGSAPGPVVTSGQPASVVVTVTNSGDNSVSGVSGQAAGVPVTCADTSLAPGESTTCQLTIEAPEGTQVIPIVITAADSETGDQVTFTRNLFLVGRPANNPGNNPGSGNGNGDGPGAGDGPSGQQPVGYNPGSGPGQQSDTPVGGVPAGSGPSATSGHGWLYGAGWVMLFLAVGAAYVRRRLSNVTEI